MAKDIFAIVMEMVSSVDNIHFLLSGKISAVEDTLADGPKQATGLGKYRGGRSGLVG